MELHRSRTEHHIRIVRRHFSSEHRRAFTPPSTTSSPTTWFGYALNHLRHPHLPSLFPGPPVASPAGGMFATEGGESREGRSAIFEKNREIVRRMMPSTGNPRER